MILLPNFYFLSIIKKLRYSILFKSQFISCSIRSSVMSVIPENSKPPNILVYTAGQSDAVAKNIVYNLNISLNMQNYVIYHLSKSEVLESPWSDNTLLLVIYSDDLTESVNEAFVQYIKKGGKLLLCCSNFEHLDLNLKFQDKGKNTMCHVKEHNAFVPRGKYTYILEDTKDMLTDVSGHGIIKTSTLYSNIVLSELHLVVDSNFLDVEEHAESENSEKRQEILQVILFDTFGFDTYSLTDFVPRRGCVITERHMVDHVKSVLGITEISLGKNEKECTETEQTELIAPLLYAGDIEDKKHISFNMDKYYSALKSKVFGRVVVYFPVVYSTMIPIRSLSNHEGIVVSATTQVCGRGRSSNIWLSPVGSAAFTLHFSLSLSSRLGQRMSVMQHMATLAVVHGIRKIPMYSKLPLQLKWPNDLYYGNDKKIGGVLVETTIQGSSVHAFVGIGVNVANPYPTSCINSVILSAETKLPPLLVEEVMAYTLTELESIIDKFESCGPDEFLSLYYSYWLHNNQNVYIQATNQEAVIRGIDDYGFLIAQSDSGIVTLQPDGNRFDIMKNLIVSKDSKTG